MFAEYRVHHSSSDSVLVRLPDKGFGKLTAATLGGDALAERLLRSLAARGYVSAAPLPGRRDAQGYRLLGADLPLAWSGVWALPVPVRLLLCSLFRKQMLVGLGTTAMARVVRRTPKGTVFSLPPNLTGVAPLESLAETEGGGGAAHDEDGDGGHGGDGMAEVRLLNYDAELHVVNVTARRAVVERTPMDTATVAAALATFTPGARVSATVLLTSTDDGCAVVELPARTPDGEPCALLGYYIYNWEGKPEASLPAASRPTVGSTLELTVEYAPPRGTFLVEATPLVILSSRHFAGLPAVRASMAAHTLSPAAVAGPTTVAVGTKRSYHAYAHGLLGFLPWRNAGLAPEQCLTPGAAGAGGGAGGDDDAGDDAPRNRRRRMEEAIDAYERQMADALPTSPEEFRRLLLAKPNSSFLWTQYMAHHVALQQYEEARQVAEKALATIGVQEELERLNVWVAYLNLENLHGTTESLAAVFKRALRRQSDEFRLYERLADVFAASRKHGQLLDLCRSMTAKFRGERRAWERLGCALAGQGSSAANPSRRPGQQDAASREAMKRMLRDMSAALRRDDAILATVHIAGYCYRHAGSPEAGRTLFEGLIAKYPRRSDVWSAYLDQEVSLLTHSSGSSGGSAATTSVAEVRRLMQRAVASEFNHRVMQQFFTRFLAFEKAHGTAADVEHVKERARQYVESFTSRANASATNAAAAPATSGTLYGEGV